METAGDVAHGIRNQVSGIVRRVLVNFRNLSIRKGFRFHDAAPPQSGKLHFIFGKFDANLMQFAHLFDDHRVCNQLIFCAQRGRQP